jgi:hypothetical protein
VAHPDKEHQDTYMRSSACLRFGGLPENLAKELAPLAPGGGFRQASRDELRRSLRSARSPAH